MESDYFLQLGKLYSRFKKHVEWNVCKPYNLASTRDSDGNARGWGICFSKGDLRIWDICSICTNLFFLLTVCTEHDTGIGATSLLLPPTF